MIFHKVVAIDKNTLYNWRFKAISRVYFLACFHAIIISTPLLINNNSELFVL